MVADRQLYFVNKTFGNPQYADDKLADGSQVIVF